MSNWTIQHRVFAVDSYTKHEGVVHVHRSFRQRFGDNRGRESVSTRKTILSWVNKWRESGLVCNVKRTGLMKTIHIPESIERVRTALQQSLTRSA
ncbi:hypothetical protein ANN_13263 [Periplaneta americana]|uniref:DUF4817 domain-containing protein n=1 Tax=Periplaneta americana TaxID=6978 RepID=A0ABQ8TKY0_PERAM|nr:hypothetical protein ANN_13263 [Periplaneta americana]